MKTWSRGRYFVSERSDTGADSKGDGGPDFVDVLMLVVVFVVVKDEVLGVFEDFLLLPLAILPHSRGQQEALAMTEHRADTKLARLGCYEYSATQSIIDSRYQGKHHKLSPIFDGSSVGVPKGQFRSTPAQLAVHNSLELSQINASTS